MKLTKDKKGLTPITIFFYVLVFVLVWALFLGDFFTDQTDALVTNNNLTGFEAFGYSVLIPLVIFIALIIFILAYMSMGGGG